NHPEYEIGRGAKPAHRKFFSLKLLGLRDSFGSNQKCLGWIFFCARSDDKVRSCELRADRRASRHDRDRHISGNQSLGHYARAADENELYVETVLLEEPGFFGNPNEALPHSDGRIADFDSCNLGDGARNQEKAEQTYNRRPT